MTDGKRGALRTVLSEYGRVVNVFIDRFWEKQVGKYALLKPVVDSVPSWLSYRLRKVAAREALDMINASKQRANEKAVKPVHTGRRMAVSSTIAELVDAKSAREFDSWLHLSSLGNKIILDLPIRLHKHWRKLASAGSRLNSYVITEDYVQFAFKIETGAKRPKTACIGVDTGIKALASLSTGEQLGTDIEANIDRIKRCKHGSAGQKRAVRALHQRMDEVAKEVASKATLLVVENLKGITQNTKRRLGKSMRRSIGRWNVRYWLSRLEMAAEWNRVSFRRVPAYNTSVTCSHCGHADRRNRNGQKFCCLKCGHEADADIQAAQNILARFLAGPYGAGCKAKPAVVL